MEIKEKNRLFIDISYGIAVSMFIIFITAYFPLLGFFMALILPMPILYFRLKLGRNPSILMMLLVFAMTFLSTRLFSGSASGIVDMLFYGALLFTGFVLGEFIELRLSIEKVFIYTVSSTIVISSLTFFIYALLTGQGVASIVSGYVSDNIKLTFSLYENMGMSKENIELISNSIEAVQYVLVRMLPALLTTLLIFIVWINTLFIKKILTKKGINLLIFQSLNRWKAPDYLVWVVIGLGLFMIIPGKSIKILAFNCIIILMSVYFFQGIAIISFIFEQKKFPPLLKISIYSIIAIQQILVLAIIGLGFFDTWMDFRKIELMNRSDEDSLDG